MSANIFAVRSGVTLTPPLASEPLPGVTLQVMIEELAEPVEERPLAPEDLSEADEVFITSSTRELMPVERILDRDLPGGASGWRVMKRLRPQLRAYVADDVRSAR